MENFNLKKFLVENKLTTNSRMLSENINRATFLREESENKVVTLADILKNKGTLAQLNGMYLKMLDGPFTQKNSQYKDKGCTFRGFDTRDGLVLVELEDGKSVRLYPKELRIDTERFNAR